MALIKGGRCRSENECNNQLMGDEGRDGGKGWSRKHVYAVVRAQRGWWGGARMGGGGISVLNRIYRRGDKWLFGQL